MHSIVVESGRPEHDERHDADRAELRAVGRPSIAVILAAGNGSRMGGEVPKPLMRVLGMRLIERSILAFASMHVRRFIVVTGAQADEVERDVRALPRLRGLSIEVVRCATWEHGNGHSLACGASAAGEPFYLAMADHVFDPEIVRRLGDAAQSRPGDVHLATDARVSDVFDLDDATKVSAIDDLIVAIGKDVPAYDRIDVGLFACPASLAGTAASVIAAGGNSVSDVMREMIDRNTMRAVAVDGLLWQDVDTPAMRREAERRMLASARKSSDGPISRWINRPVSLALTRYLARAHVTPNQITTLVFALGVLSAALVAAGAYREMLVAAVLVQAASILDGCDGEIARVSLRGSRFGAWYDTITDNIRYAALVAACSIAAYRAHHAIGYLLAGAAFVVGAIYLVYKMAAYLRRTGAPGTHLVVVRQVDANALATGRGGSWGLRLVYAIRPLGKQDVLAVIAAGALVLGRPELGLLGGLITVAAMIVAVDRAISATPGVGLRFVMGVAGAALFGWLLSRAPLGAILDAVSAVGWPIALVVPVVLAWMLANSCSLFVLLSGRVRLSVLLHNRIIGDGYNAIVPAAGVGGEPLRIALLEDYVPATEAAVAVITDRALQLAAGLILSAAALAAALVLPLSRELAVAIPIYVALATAGTLGLLLLVHGDGSARFVDRITVWLGGRPGERSHVPARTIAISFGWNLIGRALAAFEVLVYARLLGLDLSVLEIVFITGMLHAVGAAMFVIPQGIGVAEAASVYALGVLGYPATLGLAFGLIRRARIIVFSAAAVALHLATRKPRTRRA